MENIKLLLTGNPNAGKSTLFNVLTGGHAKVGNWHGVTVGALEKRVRFRGREYTVCDLPGIYSLAGMSMEEKLTRDYLMSHPNDAVVFVSECATLPRCLPLFFKLLSEGRKGVLVLTKMRTFEREGGKLDVLELQKRLGVPVLNVEKMKRIALREALFSALSAPVRPRVAVSDEALRGVYQPVREGLSRADKLLSNGWFCAPLFFVLLLLTFFLTFAPGSPGDFLKTCLEQFFTQTLTGYAQNIPSPVARSFVVDGLLSGLGGVLCVLPQIALLFFALTIMEESGFLSRLAYLADGFFSALGLNGRAVFSLLMGFGCTSAAILTTRGLDDKRIQRRVILALPYVPCSAKLPVFLALSASFFSNPFVAVVLLYVLGGALSLLTAFLLKDKKAPPFVMELAPLQIPHPVFVLKSLLFQIKQFIIKVATVVLAFFLFSWLLSSFSFDFRFCALEESMLASICSGLKYLFAPIGMKDWKIAYAALSGLIAKENVAGAIVMFYGAFPYSAASGFAFSAFMLACSPCVSAVAACAREVGVKRAIAYSAFQTGSALLLSYFVYFIAVGGGIYLLIALPPAVALFIIGKKQGERIRRNRKHKPKSVHR